MTQVELVVPGEPVPWARARRKGNRYFLDAKQKAHRQAVQNAWLVAGRIQFDGVPLEVTARFFFARPRAHYRIGKYAHLLRDDAPVYPTSKRDNDNLIKGCLDALGKGLAFDDDGQVVDAHVFKRYVEEGEEPRTELEVRALV